MTASEPAFADPSAALAAPTLDVASAKVAALSDPTTTASKQPPAKAKAESNKAENNKAESNKADSKKAESNKAASSASDGKATKRQAKAKKRHRVVRRPPPPQQLQQSFDPFGRQQMLATTATRARQ